MFRLFRSFCLLFTGILIACAQPAFSVSANVFASALSASSDATSPLFASKPRCGPEPRVSCRPQRYCRL
ncbi:MAG: hypothetical protein LUF92_14215 [Clostridiales bacterium]|nr:hypothetical protein [Clostridiales bacterium]